MNLKCYYKFLITDVLLNALEDLHKMKAYGITGNVINWFNSYLKARRQKVVIKNNSSAYCEKSAGVPQGSVQSLDLSYLLSI
jgi:hypothetical protein